MPDNPIKHSDIIQPGNPFDKAIQGLREMVKLLRDMEKEVKKSASEWRKFTEKQSASTKQGRDNLKKAARATDELSAKEKEMLRIKKALEREQAKLNLVNSSEYKQLIRTREATKAKNAELRKAAKAMQQGRKNTNRWGKALGSFQFKFNALGNIAANVLQRITSGISNFIRESTQMAAQIEGVRMAFRNLNDPKLLGELRAATKGTVSDLKLMTSAVRAKNFRIPMEELPKLFQFASQRAIETGESVDYLVESIVLGIARKSIPILDNLGLSSTEIREEMKEAGDMATAVGNIIERSMGDANKPLLTTAELYAQARANAENMKIQFGEIANLVAVKLLPVVGKMVDFLREALQTEAMIKRQVLDATTIYQIEQDRLEVQQVAQALEERNVELKENQTYEQRAALLLLQQYRTLLAGVDESDKTRIEQLTAQVQALELMAGVKPEVGSILSEEQKKRLEEEKKLIQDILDQISMEEGQSASGFGMDEDDDWAWDIGKEKAKEYGKVAGGVVDQLRQKQSDALNQEIEELNKTNEKKGVSWQDYATAASGWITQLSNVFMQQKEKELSAAGDNAEERLEIEKKYARREKILSIGQAIISGAQSIQKTKAQLGLPAAIPFIIADAAITAAQIAVIASQKFASGGHGPLGDEGSYLKGHTHAYGGVNLGEIGEAERGEYFGIINRQMARKYADELPLIFDSLNNGAFHDIWGRSSGIMNNIVMQPDPNIKRMREIMESTPQFIPEGPRTERYPDGRIRIIRNG